MNIFRSNSIEHFSWSRKFFRVEDECTIMSRPARIDVENTDRNLMSQIGIEHSLNIDLICISTRQPYHMIMSPFSIGKVGRYNEQRTKYKQCKKTCDHYITICRMKTDNECVYWRRMMNGNVTHLDSIFLFLCYQSHLPIISIRVY
jgi:hypothetical protein